MRPPSGWHDLAAVSLGGLLMVFAMWWLYFSKNAAPFLTTSRAGFIWKYGHYLIFGAAAAVGAGLAVSVDDAQHLAHIDDRIVAATVTVPSAVFILGVWALQWLPHRLPEWHSRLAPAVAVLILVATFVPEPVLVTGLLLTGLVGVGIASQLAVLDRLNRSG